MLKHSRIQPVDPENGFRSPRVSLAVPLTNAAGVRRDRSHAKRALAAAVAGAMLVLSGGLFVDDARAEEPAKPKVAVSKSYRKLVRDLLEMSGAQMAGQQVAYSVAQETLGAIASTGTEITEEIQKIVVDDALETFGGRFGDLDYLTELYAPIYAEQLKETELKALRDFYQSEAGQKALAALPAIAQAGMYSLQQSSLEMIPDFQTAVDARLREAGIVVVPE